MSEIPITDSISLPCDSLTRLRITRHQQLLRSTVPPNPVILHPTAMKFSPSPQAFSLTYTLPFPTGKLKEIQVFKTFPPGRSAYWRGAISLRLIRRGGADVFAGFHVPAAYDVNRSMVTVSVSGNVTVGFPAMKGVVDLGGKLNIQRETRGQGVTGENGAADGTHVGGIVDHAGSVRMAGI